MLVTFSLSAHVQVQGTVPRSAGKPAREARWIQPGSSIWDRRPTFCPLRRPLKPPSVGYLSAPRSLTGPVPAANHGNPFGHLNRPCCRQRAQLFHGLSCVIMAVHEAVAGGAQIASLVNKSAMFRPGFAGRLYAFAHRGQFSCRTDLAGSAPFLRSLHPPVLAGSAETRVKYETRG